MKAGAKVQPFFETTKSFFKNIFLVYFNELTPFSKAGAKVQLLFKLTKYFNKNF
ncbi:hypothetical protein HMPREF1154_1291 [Capnocytophaga sp. CM59]|nr:hypothetical protein HMPREF1154_1291 [Capnocytophaga sp. CM59]